MYTHCRTCTERYGALGAARLLGILGRVQAQTERAVMRETMSIWLTCIYVCLVLLGQPCLSMLGSRRGQNISVVVVVGLVALL